MRSATISEAKNGLSALLDRVRHGETVVITDRHRPVARLVPVPAADPGDPDEGRLARLERAGVVRRATEPPSEEILRVSPPAAESGGDVLAALLAERHEAR